MKSFHLPSKKTLLICAGQWLISFAGLTIAGIQKYFSRARKIGLTEYLADFYSDPLVWCLVLFIPLAFVVPYALVMALQGKLQRYGFAKTQGSSITLAFLLGAFFFLPVAVVSSLLLSKGVKATDLGFFFEVFLYALPLCALFFALFQAVYYQLNLLKTQLNVSNTRYQVLMQQLQPHFLFNSLNSLAMLIEIDSQRAKDVALELANLYRAILENSKAIKSSLDSEITIVRSYLEIEKMRFGKRLTVEWSIDPNLHSLLVPSLLLQTLVENALKHGIAPAVQGGVLWIAVRPAATLGYRVEVGNTGESLKSLTKKSSTHTGLANTRERLTILYGAHHDFSLDEGTFADGRYHGTVVSFYLTGL